MAALLTNYEAHVRWRGSTAEGWDRYDRTHAASATPAEQKLHLTTGESKGDPRLLNPEQLVVIAASSCHMLWFLHLAAKARIDVVDYADDPVASMPADGSLTEIVLRPRVVVSTEVPAGRILRLMEMAHDHCNIAKSLRTPVTIQPTVQISPGTSSVSV